METVPTPGSESCKTCKFKHTSNEWSSDGWDRMEDWDCSHPNLKSPEKIASSVEWHDKVKTPDWCPLWKLRGDSLAKEVGIT